MKHCRVNELNVHVAAKNGGIIAQCTMFLKFVTTMNSASHKIYTPSLPTKKRFFLSEEIEKLNRSQNEYIFFSGVKF